MAKIQYTFLDLENGKNYYGKVYTVNHKGRVNNRVDLAAFSVVPSTFPAEQPTAYTLINTYTTSQTWTAPENGYFMIEVHGASGNGGASSKTNGDVSGAYNFSTGSGGGGSGYACSVVRLKEGDAVEIVCGAVSSDSQAVVTSSYAVEDSHTMKVTSGGNGSNSGGSQKTVPGGAGGVGSGGKDENGTGSAGSKNSYMQNTSSWNGTGAAGGNPYKTDGNVGGAGGNVVNGTTRAGAAGKSGFVKISRGNTNNVG